jgi:chromatin structure-remodeling complex subunit RSC9
LTRTAENYFRPLSRETERLRGEDESEESEGDDESKTPRENKMDVDDPGSLGRRCM